MVAYTSAPSDVEISLEEKTVVLLEKKSSTGWMWKLFAAVPTVALCIGGILLFAWHWNGGPERMVSSLSECDSLSLTSLVFVCK